jgi:hypothetical protein
MHTDKIPVWREERDEIEFAKAKGFFEEQGPRKRGLYLNRPMIGRDTAINGGVYVTRGYSESVVVDDTTPDKTLARISEQFTRQMEKFSGNTSQLLKMTMEFV